MYTREQVIDAARKVLREKHNITKVCVDVLNWCQHMPTNQIEFEDLVAAMVDDTLYWE